MLIQLIEIEKNNPKKVGLFSHAYPLRTYLEAVS